MIIEWLKSQNLLNCSQFTIDWQEETIDLLEDTGNPKDEIHALRYEVENILQIIKPDLVPDVEFFNELLALLARFAEHPQAAL